MFIAIVGTRHSGRKTVASYFESRGFCQVSIAISQTDAPSHIEPVASTIEPLAFASSREMLAYITRNWQRNFVTVDLMATRDVELFTRRPFFMLMNVDAPLLMRFRRGPYTSLAKFIEEHDQLLYNYGASEHNTLGEYCEDVGQPQNSLSSLLPFVTLHILNDFDMVSSLYHHLNSLDLLNQDRLRPSWDSYFMTLASLASMRSNCMKRRVGAILVREQRIIATGYNGTPRGLTNCNEGGCAKCNGTAASNETCLCLHAEENALLEAGRERIAGATLYCNTCPCLTCTVKIVQVGVREVVYNLSYKVDDASAELFQNTGVILRRHAQPPPK